MISYLISEFFRKLVLLISFCSRYNAEFGNFLIKIRCFGQNEKKEWVRDDALIAHHPGCVPLTERHRREVNAALERLKDGPSGVRAGTHEPIPYKRLLVLPWARTNLQR